jgi:phosphatidylglycerophosphate synthase
MQAVIAIPETIFMSGKRRAAEQLLQNICGVPLLIRTVATAARAGATEILLICPEILSDELIEECTKRALQHSMPIKAVRLSEFKPQAPSSWTRVNPQLQRAFLWVPWNWVSTKRFLTGLPLIGIRSVDWSRPAYVTVHEVDRDGPPLSRSQTDEGVAVTSPDSAAASERFLVAHSGKALDGIHSSFNRRLCRPFVRLLSHTEVTPNEVTFAGVIISVVSAIAFAQGGYLASVAGALIFFVAGLFDEMDGMLARVKFAETPRGTWLEGFADGLSYLMLFAGITVGLSKQYGKAALWMGFVLFVGALLALVVTSLGRRLATAPDRPNEYLDRFYRLLEKDSGNCVSRAVRHVQAFEKRGVMIHYVVIFTVFGGLPVLFVLATIGAHLTWILALYFNHRFFSSKLSVNTPREAL